MKRSHPIRILHVLRGMDRGGVETWLMNVLRHIDRDRFVMDFLVHTEGECSYDDEIRALGSRIIRCVHPHQFWTYSRKFQELVRDYGPYDIIHSHVAYFSGNVLRLAAEAKIPVRIAHSHNDHSIANAGAGPARRIYLQLMRRWITRYATVGLAASRRAATALYGPSWGANPRLHLLYYGIDLAPFQNPIERVVRTEIGLPTQAFVVGHVGRFDPQKNHEALIDIASYMAQRIPDFHLLLVGDGELRPMIEERVRQKELAGRVIFAGSRSDVPRLMLGAMDVFLFPSLFEGLGLVLIEAQAAGLPCVISDVVPEEAQVIPRLISRLPLTAPPSAWTDAVISARASGRLGQHKAHAHLVGSPFEIRKMVKDLEACYLNSLRADERIAMSHHPPAYS